MNLVFGRMDQKHRMLKNMTKKSQEISVAKLVTRLPDLVTWKGPLVTWDGNW